MGRRALLQVLGSFIPLREWLSNRDRKSDGPNQVSQLREPASNLVAILSAGSPWPAWRPAKLGEMALGVRVTDLEGRRLSFGESSGRSFAKIVSVLTLLVGFIMAGFIRRKQALHDLFAGCLVVNNRGSAILHPTPIPDHASGLCVVGPAIRYPVNRTWLI